jgi:hypothetical protein
MSPINKRMAMRFTFSLHSLVVLLGFLTSCGSTDNSSNSAPFVNPGGVPSTVNTLTATIDGKDFKSVLCFGSKFVFFDTNIIVSGVDLNNQGIGIGITGYNTPGTYPMGSMDTSNGMIRFNIMTFTTIISSTHDTLEYQTPTGSPGDPGVGSITIVELTDTSLKATFNAVLTKTKGISGASTISITNGGVNVTLPK